MDWTPNVRVPDQTSKASPALAAFDGKLHMVHLGNSSNDIWHSEYDGRRWSRNERIPDQTSKATPALAAFDGKLHMVHLGNSSNDIWHSALDPAYTRPRYELSVSPPRVETQNGRQVIVARGRVEASGTDPESARVTLELRKDNAFWFDTSLAEATERGTDVSIDVEYECSGEHSRGDWKVFAEISRGGEKKQSSRTTVAGCGPRDEDDAGEFTFTYWLRPQVPNEGIIPWILTWDPGPPRNARLVGLERLGGFSGFSLLLWKVSPDVSGFCTREESVVLRDGQALTPDQIEFLYGSREPMAPVSIVACTSSDDGTIVDVEPIPVRITYVRS